MPALDDGSSPWWLVVRSLNESQLMNGQIRLDKITTRGEQTCWLSLSPERHRRWRNLQTAEAEKHAPIDAIKQWEFLLFFSFSSF